MSVTDLRAKNEQLASQIAAQCQPVYRDDAHLQRHGTSHFSRAWTVLHL